MSNQPPGETKYQTLTPVPPIPPVSAIPGNYGSHHPVTGVMYPSHQAVPQHVTHPVPFSGLPSHGYHTSFMQHPAPPPQAPPQQQSAMSNAGHPHPIGFLNNHNDHLTHHKLKLGGIPEPDSSTSEQLVSADNSFQVPSVSSTTMRPVNGGLPGSVMPNLSLAPPGHLNMYQGDPYSNNQGPQPPTHLQQIHHQQQQHHLQQTQQPLTQTQLPQQPQTSTPQPVVTTAPTQTPTTPTARNQRTTESWDNKPGSKLNQSGQPVLGTPNDTNTPNTEKMTKKKRKRCGECPGCLKKDNCGECGPCKSVRSHQICKMRKCDSLKTKKEKVREAAQAAAAAAAAVSGGLPNITRSKESGNRGRASTDSGSRAVNGSNDRNRSFTGDSQSNTSGRSRNYQEYGTKTNRRNNQNNNNNNNNNNSNTNANNNVNYNNLNEQITSAAPPLPTAQQPPPSQQTQQQQQQQQHQQQQQPQPQQQNFSNYHHPHTLNDGYNGHLMSSGDNRQPIPPQPSSVNVPTPTHAATNVSPQIVPVTSTVTQHHPTPPHTPIEDNVNHSDPANRHQMMNSRLKSLIASRQGTKTNGSSGHEYPSPAGQQNITASGYQGTTYGINQATNNHRSPLSPHYLNNSNMAVQNELNSFGQMEWHSANSESAQNSMDVTSPTELKPGRRAHYPSGDGHNFNSPFSHFERSTTSENSASNYTPVENGRPHSNSNGAQYLSSYNTSNTSNQSQQQYSPVAQSPSLPASLPQRPQSHTSAQNETFQPQSQSSATSPARSKSAESNPNEIINNGLVHTSSTLNSSLSSNNEESANQQSQPFLSNTTTSMNTYTNIISTYNSVSSNVYSSDLPSSPNYMLPPPQQPQQQTPSTSPSYGFYTSGNQTVIMTSVPGNGLDSSKNFSTGVGHYMGIDCGRTLEPVDSSTNNFGLLDLNIYGNNKVDPTTSNYINITNESQYTNITQSNNVLPPVSLILPSFREHGWWDRSYSGFGGKMDLNESTCEQMDCLTDDRTEL